MAGLPSNPPRTDDRNDVGSTVAADTVTVLDADEKISAVLSIGSAAWAERRDGSLRLYGVELNAFLLCRTEAKFKEVGCTKADDAAMSREARNGRRLRILWIIVCFCWYLFVRRPRRCWGGEGMNDVMIAQKPRRPTRLTVTTSLNNNERLLKEESGF